MPRAHSLVSRMTLCGVIVENRLDANPLTSQDVDDDMSVSTGTVDTIEFGLCNHQWSLSYCPLFMVIEDIKLVLQRASPWLLHPHQGFHPLTEVMIAKDNAGRNHIKARTRWTEGGRQCAVRAGLNGHGSGRTGD